MLQLPPLRLLLFVDSLEQPHWVEWMLRDVEAAGVATIVAVVRNGAITTKPEGRSRVRRLIRNWRALPLALFARYDRPRLADEPDALEVVDITAVVGNSTVIDVTPRQTKFSDFFSDDEVAHLLSLNIDVAVRLGFRILRGGVLGVAKHGVWSFHHGDNRRYRGGPPAFWEVVEKTPTTGAILQRLSEDLDGGHVLFRTCVPTDPVSPARNRARLCWAAARGLRHALARVQNGVDAPQCCDRVVPYGHRLYVPPEGWTAASVALRLIARRVVRRVLRRKPPEWRLGWRLDRTHAPGDPPDLSPHRLRIEPAPRGALQADPFVIAEGNRQHIFFEEIAPGGSIGRIAVRSIETTTELSPMRVVLERPHHLSYPTVFAWEGEWYLVPETFAAGVQEVFRATAFPDAWTLHTRWFEGDPMVDPTIFEHDGWWWLMGSRPVPQTFVGEDLYVYHAPSPLGPWSAHLQNPVRSGVDGSRPAGMPFRALGSLVRPAQYGAPHYGAGVRFWQVEVLSPTHYAERELGTIQPQWTREVVGYHTINSAGGLTVGDVLVTSASRAVTR